MPPLAPMYEVLALMLDALTDSIERDQREADKKNSRLLNSGRF